MLQITQNYKELSHQGTVRSLFLQSRCHLLMRYQLTLSYRWFMIKALTKIKLSISIRMQKNINRTSFKLISNLHTLKTMHHTQIVKWAQAKNISIQTNINLISILSIWRIWAHRLIWCLRGHLDMDQFPIVNKNAIKNCFSHKNFTIRTMLWWTTNQIGK